MGGGGSVPATHNAVKSVSEKVRIAAFKDNVLVKAFTQLGVTVDISTPPDAYVRENFDLNPKPDKNGKPPPQRPQISEKYQFTYVGETYLLFLYVTPQNVFYQLMKVIGRLTNTSELKDIVAWHGMLKTDYTESQYGFMGILEKLKNSDKDKLTGGKA